MRTFSPAASVARKRPSSRVSSSRMRLLQQEKLKVVELESTVASDLMDLHKKACYCYLKNQAFSACPALAATSASQPPDSAIAASATAGVNGSSMPSDLPCVHRMRDVIAVEI